MGLGKTVSSLTAVNDMLDDFEVNKILIIAPLKVANKVWLQESKRWEHLKHLNISICTGDTQQRIEALNSNFDIHIINRENVTWLYENVTWKWDMLIIDESSSFKSFKIDTLSF